jgi:hypothetical protein
MEEEKVSMGSMGFLSQFIEFFGPPLLYLPHKLLGV